MGYIEVQNVVTQELTDADIESMVNITRDEFDVSNEDIRAEVSYTSSATMQLSIPEETSENEVADAVSSTLANLLGVHPKDIVVTSVDMETGEIEYEVSSEIFSETSDIQSILDSLTEGDIENSMQELIPSVEVESNNVDENIKVDVSIVVDGSESGNLREARTGVENILTNLGYDVTNFKFFNTLFLSKNIWFHEECIS